MPGRDLSAEVRSLSRRDRQGRANIPALATGPTQTAKPGEIFWYITKGDLANGMPSWATTLTDEQRWQVVSYLKTLGGAPAAPAKAAGQAEAPAVAAKFEGPPPTASIYRLQV